jgi:hypothetical protein
MEVVQASSVAEVVQGYFKTVLEKEGSIVGVTETKDGWKVGLETVEYPGAGFDPTLGLYEVTVDQGLRILSYRRTHLRKLSQMTWSPTVIE